MKLANRAENISSSLTLAISSKAQKMKAEGKDVIGFGAGEPDFDTPVYIKEAARKALEKGYTGYTDVQGVAELRQAVCDRLRRDNELIYDPEQILVSNGAKHSLYNTLQVLINPGQEVIIPVPYWVSYPELVKLAGAVPVFVEGDNNFKISPRQLEENISPATGAIILNSPSNPAGVVYNPEELEQLAKVIIEHDLTVISDEIYDKILYEGCKHTSIASLGKEIKSRTVVITGMSKAYAMTGWRIGFTAGPEEIIKAMTDIQSHSTSNANSIAQYASIIGLNEVEKSRQHIEKMITTFSRRRNYIMEVIADTSGLTAIKPNGAFYIMLNISRFLNGEDLMDSIAFAKNLLQKEEVAVVPGKAFGADDYIRLSFASSLEDIKQGLKRIKNFIRDF